MRALFCFKMSILTTIMYFVQDFADAMRLKYSRKRGQGPGGPEESPISGIGDSPVKIEPELEEQAAEESSEFEITPAEAPKLPETDEVEKEPRSRRNKRKKSETIVVPKGKKAPDNIMTDDRGENFSGGGGGRVKRRG